MRRDFGHVLSAVAGLAVLGGCVGAAEAASVINVPITQQLGGHGGSAVPAGRERTKGFISPEIVAPGGARVFVSAI